MNSCFNGQFRLTSGYRTPQRPNHNGVDLVGLDDTTVYAPCDAIVIASNIVTDKNNRTWEWGNYVCLATTDGMYHIYLCHLAQRLVMAGQKVKKGDKIGIMGCTGFVDPPGVGGTHTHFEVRSAGTKNTVNAATYIGIPNTEGVYRTKSDLEEDLEVLEKYGVVNTPQYWLTVAPTVKYLDELIGNMAEVLRK